jgi:hypothetical protein
MKNFFGASEIVFFAWTIENNIFSWHFMCSIEYVKVHPEFILEIFRHF